MYERELCDLFCIVLFCGVYVNIVKRVYIIHQVNFWPILLKIIYIKGLALSSDMW